MANRETPVKILPAETPSTAVASLASGSREPAGQLIHRSDEPGPASRGESFYGWRVVAAAFTVAVFGWGTGFYGPQSIWRLFANRAAGQSHSCRER